MENKFAWLLVAALLMAGCMGTQVHEDKSPPKQLRKSSNSSAYYVLGVGDSVILDNGYSLKLQDSVAPDDIHLKQLVLSDPAGRVVSHAQVYPFNDPYINFTLEPGKVLKVHAGGADFKPRFQIILDTIEFFQPPPPPFNGSMASMAESCPAFDNITEGYFLFGSGNLANLSGIGVDYSEDYLGMESWGVDSAAFNFTFQNGTSLKFYLPEMSRLIFTHPQTGVQYELAFCGAMGHSMLKIKKISNGTVSFVGPSSHYSMNITQPVLGGCPLGSAINLSQHYAVTGAASGYRMILPGENLPFGGWTIRASYTLILPPDYPSDSLYQTLSIFDSNGSFVQTFGLHKNSTVYLTHPVSRELYKFSICRIGKTYLSFESEVKITRVDELSENSTSN